MKKPLYLGHFGECEEVREISAKDITVKFGPDDKVDLFFGREVAGKRRYIIGIVAPCGQYNLGFYKSEVVAKAEFEKFYSSLQQNKEIIITSTELSRKVTIQ